MKEFELFEEDFESFKKNDELGDQDSVKKNTVSTKLLLVVSNVEQMDTGLKAEYVFDEQGGTVGSSPNDTWLLKDRGGRIVASHFAIELIDNQFCINDLSGRTYVNHSTLPIGTNQRMIISPQDVFTVGPYLIKAHLTKGGSPSESGRLLEQKQPLGYLFDQDLRLDGSLEHSDDYQPSEDARDDPLMALMHVDPRVGRKDRHNPGTWVNQPTAQQAHDQYHTDSAISGGYKNVIASNADHQKLSANMMNSSKGNNMDAFNDIDLFLDEQKKGNTGFNHSSSFGSSLGEHIAGGPMLRGLGVPLSVSDNSGEMQVIAEEIGASLRAAIQGLLALHSNVEKSRYGLLNKNFQPIEDNPLRLGLPYQDTIKIMFDTKASAVHLSSPSAVSESMEMIKNHQEAVHEAISEALVQILAAFSPDALIRRFQRYRTARNVQDDDQDAWAWKMYAFYYQELISSRQQGFEKLFWEIFDQVYDKKMRSLQRKEV